MRWTILGLIVLGVVAALCAALLVASLQAGGNQRITTNEDGEPAEVDILVATRDLPAISVVDANSVATRTVKANEVPFGALTSPVKVIGQVVVAPMVEGQVFTKNLMATNEAGMHLSATLPEGMRAVTIVLSKAAGLGHWVYPGSLVDVVAVFRAPKEDGGTSTEMMSMVLLQGIEVLAVNKQSIVSSSEVEPVKDGNKLLITLMVDAKQAESLNLAAFHGDIALTLRNPLDTTAMVEGRGVRPSQLAGEMIEDEGDRLAGSEALPPLIPGAEPVSATVRGGATFTTDSGIAPSNPANPFNSLTAGGTNSVEESGPYWRMLVIRGRKKQVVEFSEEPSNDD